MEYADIIESIAYLVAAIILGGVTITISKKFISKNKYKVIQKGNIVKGDMAGRDIDK